MSGIQSQHQLEVTRKKLASLEELYASAKARPVENEFTRELTLRSIMKMINQMKEEIVRFEAGGPANESPRRGIRNEAELEISKEKRRSLEELYHTTKNAPGSDSRARSLVSIKKMINQLTEEIVRFESRAVSVGK